MNFMSRELSISSVPIAVAVYLPEQYPRLLATAEDANNMEATWQEWYQVLQETRQKMATMGMYLIDVTVDIDELNIYCQQQGLANTGSMRAEYAAHVLTEQRQVQLQLQSSLKQRAKKKKRRLR